VGDATKANAALGAEILSRAAKGLVQLLEDVERVDVDAG
jgi:creatinine amidohydrolase/Fe(II)-dependent formamide hydrolase-like protein